MTDKAFIRALEHIKKFILKRSCWLDHRSVNVIKNTLCLKNPESNNGENNDKNNQEELKSTIRLIEDILDFLDKRSYKKISHDLIKGRLNNRNMGPDYLRDRCLLVLAFLVQLNNDDLKNYIKGESELQEVILKDSEYILQFSGWLDHFGGWGVLKRSIIVEFYSNSDLNWLKSEILRCPYTALDYSNIDPQIWLDYLTKGNKKILYNWNHGLVLVKSHIKYSQMEEERAELITQLLKLSNLPVEAWKELKSISPIKFQKEEINKTNNHNNQEHSDYGRNTCNGARRLTHSECL